MSNQTVGQKAMMAARIVKVIPGNKGTAGRVTIAEAAAKMGVGTMTIVRARKVLKNGSVATIAAVEEGRISIYQAYEHVLNNVEVPTVKTRRGNQFCSDEMKIERAIDSISTVSGYLVRFSGHAVKREWVKSLTESKRNLRRFLKGGWHEAKARSSAKVPIEDPERENRRSTPSPESAA